MILKLFYEKINITLFKLLKNNNNNCDFFSFLYQKIRKTSQICTKISQFLC